MDMATRGCQVYLNWIATPDFKGFQDCRGMLGFVVMEKHQQLRCRQKREMSLLLSGDL